MKDSGLINLMKQKGVGVGKLATTLGRNPSTITRWRTGEITTPQYATMYLNTLKDKK